MLLSVKVLTITYAELCHSVQVGKFVWQRFGKCLEENEDKQRKK